MTFIPQVKVPWESKTHFIYSRARMGISTVRPLFPHQIVLHFALKCGLTILCGFTYYNAMCEVQECIGRPLQMTLALCILPSYSPSYIPQCSETYAYIVWILATAVSCVLRVLWSQSSHNALPILETAFSVKGSMFPQESSRNNDQYNRFILPLKHPKMLYVWM